MARGRGWHGEPGRHADAARGIKTKKLTPEQEKLRKATGEYIEDRELTETYEAVVKILESDEPVHESRRERVIGTALGDIRGRIESNFPDADLIGPLRNAAEQVEQYSPKLAADFRLMADDIEKLDVDPEIYDDAVYEIAEPFMYYLWDQEW